MCDKWCNGSITQVVPLCGAIFVQMTHIFIIQALDLTVQLIKVNLS